MVEGGRFMVMLEGDRLRVRPPRRLIAVVRGGGAPSLECIEEAEEGLDALVMVIAGDCREGGSSCCFLSFLSPPTGGGEATSSFFSSSATDALVSVGMMMYHKGDAATQTIYQHGKTLLFGVAAGQDRTKTECEK